MSRAGGSEESYRLFLPIFAEYLSPRGDGRGQGGRNGTRIKQNTFGRQKAHIQKPKRIILRNK